MQKKKKMYYTPGIICLFILPFLFINQASQYKKQINHSYIESFWPSASMENEYMKAIKGSGKHKRHYINIDLKESVEDNAIKLAYAQLRIREIIASNDSINGVKFHFSESTPYGSFVKALDILRVEGAKRYIPIENNLWFLHEPPQPEIMDWVCGTTYQYIYIGPSKWQVIKKKIHSVWQSSWQLIISFSIFLVFNLYAIKRSTHQ
jgi:hypothetical protein